MKLTIVIKEFYSENIIFLKKDIVKDMRKQKTIAFHGLTKCVIIVNMTILPKAIFRFSINLIRITISFFTKVPKSSYGIKKVLMREINFMQHEKTLKNKKVECRKMRQNRTQKY